MSQILSGFSKDERYLLKAIFCALLGGIVLSVVTGVIPIAPPAWRFVAALGVAVLIVRGTWYGYRSMD